MANINLEDVLAGQHLSPFTLGEFEDHLVHVQRSAENLYFYFWLSDYTKKYREWKAGLDERKGLLIPISANSSKQSTPSRAGIRDSMRPAHKGVVWFVPRFVRNVLVSKTKSRMTSQPQMHEVQLSSIPQVLSKAPVPKELQKSFASLQAFVIPPRQALQALHKFEWELNISQQLKDQFRHQAENSMDPDIFLPIKKEVMNMLSDSMRRWLMDCSGNSDKHRAQLTLCIGASCVGVAVIGTALLMTKATSAEMRLCLSPLVWIGLEIFFCGLFRTCPLIFMFGSFRQIHVWELGRAKEAAAITEKNLLSKRHDFLFDQANLESEGSHTSLPLSESQRGMIPSEFSSSDLQKMWDAGFDFRSCSNNLLVHNGSDTRKPSHLASTMNCSSPNDVQAFTPTDLTTPCAPTTRLNSRRHLRPIRSHSSSTPIFGPLTQVLSPVAIRQHRMNILKSVVLATMLTAVWVALCLLVHIPHDTHSSRSPK